MGKFNVEEEEKVTATAIEEGMAPEEFGAQLTESEDEFDPFEALMAAAAESESPVTVSEDDTLFADIDYVKTAIPHFNKGERNTALSLQTVNGVEISISPELRRRLAALLPDEVQPKEDFLRLSPDKQFVMSEMTRSMQNNLSETAWPTTQFLWKLHPLFTWINDKSSLLYGRNEAPVIGVSDGLDTRDYIFIMAGTIPNRKSAPVVDEWFGLYYKNGTMTAELSMEEVLRKTRIGAGDIPNQNLVTEEKATDATALLRTVVTDAEKVLARHYKQYNDEMAPKINDELNKLAELEGRHKSYQMSLFEDERRKSEKERMVEAIFNNFADWVRDTLEIEDNPYIRVIAVVTGVNA